MTSISRHPSVALKRWMDPCRRCYQAAVSSNERVQPRSALSQINWIEPNQSFSIRPLSSLPSYTLRTALDAKTAHSGSSYKRPQTPAALATKVPIDPPRSPRRPAKDPPTEGTWSSSPPPPGPETSSRPRRRRRGRRGGAPTAPTAVLYPPPRRPTPPRRRRDRRRPSLRRTPL